MIVSLSGWSTPREIIEHDGKLYFSLVKHRCCFTCLSRIEHIRSTISKNKLQVTYGYLLNYIPLSDNTLWVKIKMPKGKMSKEEIIKILNIKTLWIGIEKPKDKMSNEEIINFFCENFELPVLGVNTSN